MEVLSISLLITYLVIASILDIKTREIPHSLGLFFISIGIFIQVINYIFLKDQYLFTGLLWVAIFFVVGIIMYYASQWGGADSMILITIAALVPKYPEFILNNFTIKSAKYFGIDVFLNILIIGSIYSFIIAMILALKHRKKIAEKFKKVRKKKIEITLITGLIILNIISVLTLDKIGRYYILALSVLTFLFYYLIIIAKLIEKIHFYKKIPTAKLREGDYVIDELKHENKLVYKPIVHGVSKEKVIEIKKYFKEVEIRDGIPLIPAILLAVTITLLKGSLILYLLP